jgi:hypothetical protein
MAANNFDASALTRVNVKLEQMFLDGGLTQSHLKVPAVTAKALLTNQTARSHERLENGNCVGVKAYYMKGNSTATDTIPGCDTPAGTKAETASKNYDNEVLVGESASAEDNRCGNEMDFVQESAFQIATMIANARKRLNAKLLGRVIANTGQDIYQKYPDSTWSYDAANTQIELPYGDLTWRKLTHVKRIIAGNNYIKPLILTGQNYTEEFWDAMIKKDQNCCEGGVAYAFQGMNMYFDDRDLEAQAGVGVHFALDANNYLFWNSTRHSAAPTRIGGDANGEKWVWTVNDPELRYFRDGALVPVKYEVEMQKKCINRDALGYTRWTYAFYLRLIGGFAFAPLGAQNETGVLKFQAV